MSADPWLIGLAHEGSASEDDRQQRGAWYTPRPVVEGLLRLALPGDAKTLPRFVVDPTCGGGAFLLGTLDRLVALGLDPADAIHRVGGMDIDPGAVEAAGEATDLWCEQHGLGGHSATTDRSTTGRARLAVGDALSGLPAGWPRPDLIVGNPPFATPLRGRALPEAAAEYRARHADLLGPYADLAAIHLASAMGHVAPGGTVCLVLPQSLLAGRDTAGLRAHLDEVASPRALWATREAVFDAGVRVFAPVLQRGHVEQMVELATGVAAESLGSTAPAAWAALAAEALGVPAVDLENERTIGNDDRLGLVTATAGFRDEYYGLVAACVEGEAHDLRPRLATVGSLDPLQHYWGERPTTFAKSRWDRPVVDRDALEPRTAAWLERQLRPKVVLPTQSRVFEPVVDLEGRMAPVTPVLSIHAEPKDLALVAAVFLAPPVVGWAARRWFGGALSVDAIKLAARDVASLPTPPGSRDWEAAAELVAKAAGQRPADGLITEIGSLMNAAYGADDAVLEWWLARLP